MISLDHFSLFCLRALQIMSVYDPTIFLSRHLSFDSVNFFPYCFFLYYRIVDCKDQYDDLAQCNGSYKPTSAEPRNSNIVKVRDSHKKKAVKFVNGSC